MNFRAQMLVAFAPIFLLLGASGGTVMTLLDRREAKWGLDEEGSTLAVAISEFLGDRPFAVAKAGPAHGRTWQESLGMVIRRGQARRLFVFGPDGRDARWHSDLPVEGGPPVVPEDVKAELRSGQWVDTGVTRRKSESVLSTYSALRAPDGRAAGYLLVEIGAEDYVTLIDQGLRTIALGAGLSLLVGLFAMEVIVVPVVGGLRKLRESADRALEGETLAHSGTHHIQEIGDLAQTFDTVGTLLNEAVEKTKRTLVENEQLRTPADLASAFHTRFNRVFQAELGRVSASACLVGADPGGAFFGCHSDEGEIRAFVGVVAAPDELQQAIQASAARAYLVDALARLPVAEAFSAAASFFTISSWQCAAWPLKGRPVVWSGRSGVSGVAQAEANPDAPLCIHTPRAAHQAMVDACLANFKTLPANELLANLVSLADIEVRGALLVLQPCKSSPSSPAS
jgi:hypothetical protein